MEESVAPPSFVPAPPAPGAQGMAPLICPRCHFAVKPEYYYCPNCGVRLSEPPLAADLITQFLLYGFSIALPWIAYLAVTKWPGIKYLRSPDGRTKQIGLIMLILLIASSVVAFWLTYEWVQNYVQQSLSDINNLGF